jgi:hypothetical protein
MFISNDIYIPKKDNKTIMANPNVLLEQHCTPLLIFQRTPTLAACVAQITPFPKKGAVRRVIPKKILAERSYFDSTIVFLIF